MRIIMYAVNQAAQRYDTLGDWFYDVNGDLVIKVTGETIKDPETFLIALHELVESRLCEARGISQSDVDQSDFNFAGDGEPGDAEGSPYSKEHRFAMLVEHLLAHELGVSPYGKVE